MARSGRIQAAFGLFVLCGLRACALVAYCFAIARTTDTRIFSRPRDRFFIRINEIKGRIQSALRSGLRSELKIRRLIGLKLLYFDSEVPSFITGKYRGVIKRRSESFDSISKVSVNIEYFFDQEGKLYRDGSILRGSA